MVRNKNNKSFLSENLYRQCVDLLPIITVDVLILDKNLEKTLLFRRNNEPLKNIYYSIGGRIYKNENFLNTAIRICKEEVDLQINKGDLTFGAVTEEIFHNSIYDGVNAHNVNIFFGYISTGQLTIHCDEQHSCFKWFKLNDPNLHPYIVQKIHLLLPNMSQNPDKNLNKPEK